MKITFFGLGEAGGLIATDLARLDPNIDVHGYDPADTVFPDGVTRHHRPQEAVRDADYIFALTASADSSVALQQAIEVIPEHAIYADFASASPGLKKQLASIAERHRIAFCDVALMSMVPGNGLRTPTMVSGNGAVTFSTAVSKLGMPVTLVSEVAGDAAMHKLLRSVTMKGLAAVLIESLQGAAAAGCEEWLWDNICEEFRKADRTTVERLVAGTQIHARRRLHEMEASRDMLIELGIEPVMTRSTVANLEQVLLQGIPDIPVR